jgi:hypothetical protein
MKKSKAMKPLIVLICLFCFWDVKAQLDTSFTLVRFGTPGIFNYKKYTSAEQFKNIRGLELPQYSFNEMQFNRIKGLLDKFITNESDYILLRKNFDKKDSIYNAKIAVYNQIDSIQGLRSKNFEQAYNSLVMVNTQFNQQLINCKEIAEKEVRKGKLNSVMYGILGGLTSGVILGVFVAHSSK